ncbi:MAG: hypothetical protein N2C14_02315, partial [Planctomycetales bacterium]
MPHWEAIQQGEITEPFETDGMTYYFEVTREFVTIMNQREIDYGFPVSIREPNITITTEDFLQALRCW